MGLVPSERKLVSYLRVHTKYGFVIIASAVVLVVLLWRFPSVVAVPGLCWRFLCALWHSGITLTTTEKVLLAVAVIYILSPLDVLPDFIPVVGWMDDVAFFYWALGPAIRFTSRWAAAAPVG